MPRRVGSQLWLSRLTYRATLFSSALRWLRHRGLSPNDRFVASYPRSGSTWLRFMLYAATTGASPSFQNVNRAIPDVGRHRQAPSALPSKGRLVKTHESYRHAYGGGVYVVRDPRSVVVSEFRWATGVDLYRGSFDRFVDDFVAGRVHRFGSWAENVGSWVDGPAAEAGRLLVLRFEDMRADPVDALGSASAFLGLSPSAERIRDAVEDTAIDNMRRKEDTAGPELRERSDASGRFINRGSSDEWAELLRPDQIRSIEEHAGSLMSRFGYGSGAPAAPGSVSG